MRKLVAYIAVALATVAASYPTSASAQERDTTTQRRDTASVQGRDTTLGARHVAPAPSSPDYLGARSSVREALSGGQLVTLEDGTIWEIYPPDRVYTVGWRPGGSVLVRLRAVPLSAPLSGPGHAYDHLLINGTEGLSASARFRGVGGPELRVR